MPDAPPADPGPIVTAPVFLDACVLYPPLLRHLLIGTARAGLYRPLWSARVLAEWEIAVARKEGAAAAGTVAADRARLAAAFPGAEIGAAPETEAGLALPDPADAHVLAAAIAGGAGVLLTFNLRDFPARRLAGHGIAPRHPDGFLWELASHAPAVLAPLLARGTGSADPSAQRRALKRARLPRLGKGRRRALTAAEPSFN